MISHKPFSQACQNNQQAILDVLKRHLADTEYVLEVGSGTGQHAAFFAPRLPHLLWQTSDLSQHHDGITLWVEEAAVDNLRLPLELDVTVKPWPIDATAAVFSANTAHIMSWSMVRDFITGVGQVLATGGVFCLYGPFNYAGSYTSESNQRFDQSLRQRGCGSAIRDFEAVDEIARAAGLSFVEDNAMPANNRLLVWRKGLGGN
jgi:cyclopropane fatty-acyl-phospholipid synthase-like methyltransferase